MKLRYWFAGLVIGVITWGGTPVFAADVNNFRISSYKIDYVLGKDSDGRSTLKTTETITAEFPDIDQNHGLERAIPKTYDGHRTNIQIESVRDGEGAAREFSTRDDDNGNLVVRMADMGKYVHGTQTYVLTYSQRDVTKAYASTKSDEFYWDTNGVDWRVPIDNLEVALQVDGSLVDRLTMNTSCYQGRVGASTQCDLLFRSDNELFVQATGLAPGENVTIAVGFSLQTFTPYQQTLAEKLVMWWGVWQVITLVPIIVVFAWLIRKFYRLRNRPAELGTIVPEYVPPRDVSVAVAAKVAPGTSTSVMSAQLLDLAVRHYIKLYEVKEKTIFSAAEYEVEISRDLSDLRAEERELLEDMFAGPVSAGARMNLKSLRNNMGYYQRTQDDDTKLDDLVRTTYQFYTHDVAAQRWFRIAAAVLAIVSLLLLVPLGLIAALVVYGCSFATWPLSDKGLALRRYLMGLKQYIKVAETERLEMLQSPEGAEKSGGLDTNDPAKLVKLYEKVLPYAVLFGQEKQWNQQLGRYYEQAHTQPDWYAGHNGAFNAAAFSTGMSGLSQAASYTSSSSSSSGGSSGGGSSGGGGGGGGGGGV